MRFYLETLGCPKNLVDSQGMARLLHQLGHEAVDDPRQAGLLIVNTCGFIEDARRESIEGLKQLARRKRPRQWLIAAGCLAQWWGPRLAEAVPGIDGLLGTRRWSEIGDLVAELGGSSGRRARRALSWRDDPVSARVAAGPYSARQGASAYLKIAEGCSAPCAFCTIPLIKGPAVSRPAQAIVQNAVDLVREGVQELILIAQDTTAYGRDRGERDALPGLVQAILNTAPDLRWLRLLYAYPGRISSALIETMAGDPRVCHYLDLPLQHAHPAVLRRMRRPADVDETRRLLAELRAAMPDIALRTSFIAGFPGESESEFEALLDFVSEARFDRLGVFVYSPEAGTPAFDLPGPIPGEVKAERHGRLMAAQQQISLEINQAQVGRTLDVLIEGRGDNLSIGRSYRDAPEIDGLVLVPGELEVGSMVPVRITGAMEYDLVGEVAGVIEPG